MVEPAGRRPPLDVLVVPGLLLLVARELALFAPLRELAWQLFHDTRVERRSAFLGSLRPHPSGAWDADPVSLALAAVAAALALVYLGVGLAGTRPRWRAFGLGVAVLLLVALPTAGFIGLGQAMRVPYGHDGGVVQLPLAMDKILAGESPYGADYSRSILGRQSRSSEFWQPFGGNPIVRHHWYLPGIHLLMIPPYVLIRALLGFFDPRMVTLAAYLLAAWLASRLVEEPERRLTAAALVVLHPLVWWPQVFGVNDIFCALPLMLAFLAAKRQRPVAAALWLGLACAVKQLIWPFAPFLVVLLSGVRSFRELSSVRGWLRLARPAGLMAAVFFLVVAPLAAVDFKAFLGDIVLHQVGLPGMEQYPLGGTPGFGIGNFLIYFGLVERLSDPFPFSRLYVFLVPLGLLLLQRQFREPKVSTVLVNGSVALLGTLYLSRIVNPNYLTLAVVLLPLGVLMERRRPVDLALVPVLLLTLGLETIERELFAATWAQAEVLGYLPGLPAWLAPRPGPRWRDPLTLGFGALAAGLGIAYLVTAWSGATRRLRYGLLILAALLTVALPSWVVFRTGQEARTVRVQDRWWAEVVGERTAEVRDGRRLPPMAVAEAWSTSFRKLEPREYAATPGPPGRWTLGRLLRAAGGIDPRWLAWLALAAGAWFMAHLVAPTERLAALALLLLSPVAAVSSIFGSGVSVALALLLAGAWLVQRGRARGAGLCFGSACALAPWSLWATLPLALGAAPREGRALRSVVLGFVVGLGVLGLPRLIADPGTFWAGLVPEADAASVGLSNVLAYHGVEGSALARGLGGVAILILGLMAAAWWLWSGRERGQNWAAAAVLALAALWLNPVATAHDLLVPFVLLGVAAMAGHGVQTPASSGRA